MPYHIAMCWHRMPAQCVRLGLTSPQKNNCTFKGIGMTRLVSTWRWTRAAAAAVVVAGSLGLLAEVADARPGKGFSFGSRGSKTYSAPPSTATAPGTAAPMQKSITQPGQSAATAARPTAGMAQAAPARSNMMRNLLLGGLVGAGLASIFGVGAFASVLGFLLQTLLIGGVIWLAVQFFRNRSQQAAYAGATAGAAPPRRDAASLDAMKRSAAGNSAAAGGAASAAAQARPATGGPNAAGDLKLGSGDFDTFERLLGEVQSAYGREDIKALETRLTPEMLSYFADELATNKRNGVINRISGIKLLQGDLAESWAENGADYATVAMRYAITDQTIDRASGRVVEGRASPDEVTEVWTFVRRAGSGSSGWELSAIQQT